MQIAFNNLSPSIQSQISNLKPTEQVAVMMEIIRQTSTFKEDSNNELNTDYKTVHKLVADELYEQIPILAVSETTVNQQDAEINNNSSSSNNTSSNNTSSNNTSSNNTSSGSIKHVAIL
jgi:hypothetical protein